MPEGALTCVTIDLCTGIHAGGRTSTILIYSKAFDQCKFEQGPVGLIVSDHCESGFYSIFWAVGNMICRLTDHLICRIL